MATECDRVTDSLVPKHLIVKLLARAENVCDI